MLDANTKEKSEMFVKIEQLTDLLKRKEGIIINSNVMLYIMLYILRKRKKNVVRTKGERQRDREIKANLKRLISRAQYSIATST